ncbi:MAG: DNA primase [Alphaproteobacteria bacterium]|nr:DNA primase [Alphaproteobacteria bacterium]MBN2675357.1 DNA primase [Alphaproteobacteria bacterium]
MANYNSNFTDELRERLSIVDVVGRRVPLTKKGQNFWGCCPFHNEKTPSFSVNEEKGFYHCFGCGEHGDIISFTMKSGNMDFIAAITELAQQAGLKMPDYKPKSVEEKVREDSYVYLTEAAAKIYQQKLFEPDGAFALEYIKKRGFSIESIKKYCLGYAPKSNIISTKFSNTNFEKLSATGLVRRGDYGNYDFFRDRLMFPIFNIAGQVIAFSGRSLDGSEPKYINTIDTELFHKRKTVFGLNFARDSIHRANRSIVVEGQIDVIQMQVHGFGETVAPLGTALTEDHIAILCKSNRNITFCFDGDTAGQKAAARACSLVLPFLRDNSDVKFAFVTGGKDPDDILKSSDGINSMKKIIDSAQPLVDFLWDSLNKNYLVSTPGGRSQAEKFLKKELEKLTDTSLRSEYEKEYNSRKFNQWHKWDKKKNAPDIEIPDVDQITINSLKAVINKYPELGETHIEFLATLGINFDKNISHTELSFEDAEKLVVSLKLKKYLEKLHIEKKELFSKMLVGDETVRGRISDIDAEIIKSNERLNLLSGV